MWHVVYDDATGKSVSSGTVLGEKRRPGHKVKTFTEKPDLKSVEWDETTKDYAAKPPRVERLHVSTILNQLTDDDLTVILRSFGLSNKRIRELKK